MNALREECQRLRDELIALRREFHRTPELGLHEYHTAARIERELDRCGIPHERVGETAVVGHLTGNGNGSGLVVLRADIDALPIQETNAVPYRSQTPGKMHACGHDAHTTILLGAGKLLNEMRSELKGNVKLFFQPAEETDGGAEKMIKLGCMENPHVDYVLGLHVMPYMPVGDVETRYGALNGASDEIDITVYGKKSHGARPNLGVDAIAIAAQIITALQQQVSRRTSPLDSTVVSIGMISGGTAGNIVCDEVHMNGTLRTISPETREQMRTEIVRVSEGIAAAMGGRAECAMRPSYCALINDKDAVDRTLKLLRSVLGEEHVHIKDAPSLGVEDFSYFCRERPGAFYHIGMAPSAEAAKTWPELHTSEMDIDERVLPLGAELQTRLVLDYLNGQD